MFSLLIFLYVPRAQTSLGITPTGWEKVSEFSKGNLYKSTLSDNVTLTSFREEGHMFIFNQKIKVDDYLDGLSEVREATLGIGGLKNWKLNRLISQEHRGHALVITFESQFERADDTVVQMFERHIFYKSQFFQWQISADKEASILKDHMVLKTFEELTREVNL